MDIKAFFRHNTPQNLIITANRRLASYLQKNYDQFQIKQGKTAWANLNILPLSNWIEHLWDKLNQGRLPLTEFQELLLWENIIAHSKEGEDLINPAATAKLAKDTWQLMHQWLLDLDELAHSSSIDALAFVAWAKQFQKQCEELNCISHSELMSLLLNQFVSIMPYINAQKILLLGFDDLSPALKKLISYLETIVTIETLNFVQHEKSVVSRTAFIDKEQEWQAMAHWAYDKLTTQPQAVVGCVVPNLAENRNQITQIFEDVFYAQQLTLETPPPFNISAARYLNQFPIIQVALNILSLDINEMDVENFSVLLRTPYVKYAEQELNSRAQLDAQLRSLGEKKICLVECLKNKLIEKFCPKVSHLLHEFCDKIRDLQLKFSLIEWARHFTSLLNVFGWPGERSLNSTEFQLVERFKKLLSEFAALNYFTQECTLNEALHLLQKLINGTLFQPKSVDTPIQILGILEASGIAFDYLWVAGLDNESWPAAPSPNPFIPFEIQRQHAMPHATSERELHYSRVVTTRFIQNAGEIIFSHCEFDKDRPLAPSPLITPFSNITFEAEKFISLDEYIFNTQKFELLLDEVGPPILENFIIGGSAIFKSQAACPFQAFARFRLNAEPLDELQLGLAFHERGLLVHEILSGIWKKLESHAKLCALTDDELKTIIATFVTTALIKMQQRKPFTLKTTLFALEKKRLQQLIFNWLQSEKNRSSFTVVSAEQKQTAVIKNLSIHVQIDRIDQLEDDSRVIIDYKTGRPSIVDWFGDRPNEPQLPLYATIIESNLSGILFAQVRRDKMTFKGVVAVEAVLSEGIIPQRLEDNNFKNILEVVDYWRNILHKLADDFCQGYAKVSPKDVSTCQYCDLHMLCRTK